MSLFKKIGLLISDIAILYLSLGATLLLRYGVLGLKSSFETHLLPFSLLFIIWLLIFYLADLYRHQTLRNLSALFKALVVSVFIAGIVSIIVFYLFGGIFKLTPKTNLLIFGGVFLILDYLWRAAVIRFFTLNLADVIIIGDSPLINETVSYLNNNPSAGYKVAYWFKGLENVTLENLTGVIKEKKSQFLIIQPHLTKNFSNLNLVYRLLPTEVGIINFWDFYEMIFEKVPLDELEENWFIENVSARRPFYDATKRALDLLLSLILGLILLPLAVLIAFIIKISSRGPVLYKQKRTGKKGSFFKIYKFRTMADGGKGPLWTETNDTRITGFGKILRFSHLDEIPQLWNIIKGDISFTGPRPERTELAEQYEKFSYYEIRHIVKPGLTGWAQINYKPSASLEEGFEKLKYDIYYVKNRSFLLDILILLRTVKYFFTNHGQ